jgi:hypothetical protein
MQRGFRIAVVSASGNVIVAFTKVALPVKDSLDFDDRLRQVPRIE